MGGGEAVVAEEVGLVVQAGRVQADVREWVGVVVVSGAGDAGEGKGEGGEGWNVHGIFWGVLVGWGDS